MQSSSTSLSAIAKQVERKPYVAPHLESLGSVRDIVQAGAASVTETNPGQGAPQGSMTM